MKDIPDSEGKTEAWAKFYQENTNKQKGRLQSGGVGHKLIKSMKII